jgi:hypothetical protein
MPDSYEMRQFRAGTFEVIAGNPQAESGRQRSEARGQKAEDKRMAEFDSLVPIRLSVDGFEPPHLVSYGFIQAVHRLDALLRMRHCLRG